MVTEKVAKVATEKNENNADVYWSGLEKNNFKICDESVTLVTFGDQKVAKVAKKFECKNCDYITSRKSNYDKHVHSVTHFKKVNNIITTKEMNKEHVCEFCEKIYQSKNGLWVHKKKCKENIKNTQIIEINNQLTEMHSLTNLVVEVVKQNQEFQKMIAEQNKQIITLSKTTNITNNNCNNITHNKFNINLFLNEKCKDAINMNDFVNSLKLTFSDLENVGTNGFVNGISNIFVKGLKELDVYKRPVHCSDLKRETLYIKDSNLWEKENEEKEKLKKAIKDIASKNISKITEWTTAYPSCKNSSSVKNDQYMQILNESMCSEMKEEEDDKYNKIIKILAKEVIIDKI
jgi:hypothetical protein